MAVIKERQAANRKREKIPRYPVAGCRRGPCQGRVAAV